MGLGVVLFALVVLERLTTAFVVNGHCGNTACIPIYDASPLFLPSFYGAVLFSVGTIMIFLIGPRANSNKPDDFGPSRSRKTTVLLVAYAAVPICVFLLLLSNANLNLVHLSTWSGFPATYYNAGCLASLIVGPFSLTPCYTLIWEGFWIDMLFYTAWSYAIIILATLIPRLKPPHLAFPELEDLRETRPPNQILSG